MCGSDYILARNLGCLVAVCACGVGWGLIACCWGTGFQAGLRVWLLHISWKVRILKVPLKIDFFKGRFLAGCLVLLEAPCGKGLFPFELLKPRLPEPRESVSFGRTANF